MVVELKDLHITAFTVCVNFDDYLESVIPYNLQHFHKWVIISSREDMRTRRLIQLHERMELYTTDAFYDNGAKFNKGAAIEESLRYYETEGWNLIIDSDIVLPTVCKIHEPSVGCLYTPVRHNVLDLRDWSKTARSLDVEWSGYFQLFHSSDPVLLERPWYSPLFIHAGGGDCYFQNKWHNEDKLRPDFEVLHLGERDVNWFGRVSDRLDGEGVEGAKESAAMMEKFLCWKGWGRRKNGETFKDTIN